MEGIELSDLGVNEKGQLCETPGLASRIARGEYSRSFDDELLMNFIFSCEHGCRKTLWKVVGDHGICFGYNPEYKNKVLGW